MIFVNTFEEFFGDIHGKGVWSKFSGQASSSLSSNVVALASYNGEFIEMCPLLFYLCFDYN